MFTFDREVRAADASAEAELFVSIRELSVIVCRIVAVLLGNTTHLSGNRFRVGEESVKNGAGLQSANEAARPTRQRAEPAGTGSARPFRTTADPCE